jgi:hypothetical protein
MRLVCVPPDRVAEVWPHVREWIKAAMERADIGSFSRAQDDAALGYNLLWIATDGNIISAAATTEIRETELRKVCVIMACGGENMKDWIHLIDGLHDYAKAEGCAAMRVLGPRAWLRKLDGYHEQAVILERKL